MILGTRPVPEFEELQKGTRMIRGRRRIEFEGLLQKNVLGTFDVIRGFADLRDLAEVSVAMPYEGSGLAAAQVST